MDVTNLEETVVNMILEVYHTIHRLGSFISEKKQTNTDRLQRIGKSAAHVVTSQFFINYTAFMQK